MKMGFCKMHKQNLHIIFLMFFKETDSRVMSFSKRILEIWAYYGIYIMGYIYNVFLRHMASWSDPIPLDRGRILGIWILGFY